MILLDKELGPEAGAKIELAAGKIILSMALDSKGLGGELKLSLDSEYFLDELAAKIPGQIDDAVLAVLKAAFKQL